MPHRTPQTAPQPPKTADTVTITPTPATTATPAADPPPAIETTTDNIATQIQQQAPSAQLPQGYISPLMAAEIKPPDDIATVAQREGWQKSQSYGAARVRTLTQKQIFAQTLRMKQYARQAGYNLAALLSAPSESMIDALDRFDLVCFELDLQPLEHLLAVWLNCSMGELDAVKTTANINPNAKLIVDHQAFAVSVIAQNAMQSDRPPVFSMYYLKAVHKMFDAESPQNAQIAINNTTINARFSIDKTALQNNAQLFSTLPDSK